MPQNKDLSSAMNSEEEHRAAAEQELQGLQRMVSTVFMFQLSLLLLLLQRVITKEE